MDNIIPTHQQTGYYGKGTGLYRHIRGRRRKARRHHPGKRGAERHHPCKPGLSPIPEIPAGQTTHPCRLTSTTTNHQRKNRATPRTCGVTHCPAHPAGKTSSLSTNARPILPLSSPAPPHARTTGKILPP